MAYHIFETQSHSRNAIASANIDSLYDAVRAAQTLSSENSVPVYQVYDASRQRAVAEFQRGVRLLVMTGGKG